MFECHLVLIVDKHLFHWMFYRYTDVLLFSILHYSFSIFLMPSFSQMKDLYKMQRDAKRIKSELKNIHVEAEAEGVKVVVSAEQEIISITIEESVPRERIGSLTIDALNRALKKAQLVAAERMQGIMKQMGLATGGESEE